MAIQINSMAELEEVLMRETFKAMVKTEDTLVSELKEKVDKEVYDAYTPDRYKRTGALRESIEVDTYGTNYNNTKATITVHHNRDKAKWFSVKDGSDYDYVPETVSLGKYGTFVGQGIDAYGSDMHDIRPRNKRWSKSRPYMNLTEKEYMNILSGGLPSNAYIK